MKIGIIGSAGVGQVLAKAFKSEGHDVMLGTRNTSKEEVVKFKNENDFLILSHTCDPEQDSAAQLKKYSDSLGVNTSRWMFLTGRKDSLYIMARISYTIDDPANNLKSIDDDFLHTQFWALVDRNGDVRKIYDGLKQNEINELIRDIKKMLKEKN